MGDFAETFRTDLTFWGPGQYERSWARALLRLEEADVTTSCLVSSITDPKTANFVFCLTLYRVRDDIFVQNSLILLGELDDDFDPENPWLSIGSREVADEDGNRISEWCTDITAVREFCAMLRWG
ncbi:hypothetical protein AQJ91_41710 [Streptomyces dysideae]|uniref:CdiI C-terminal domain-containing protein n=1 Tax=Streptomyces dysideae TaxID=909626 RepID=A0A101UR62_9ACTN|nr:hypothetical protein AQJ91_41710 [Streptomyces dysideae]